MTLKVSVELEQGLRRAAELVTAAGRIVVFSGAGMSQESGIPTFRDAQTGLWSRFRPEELATPQAFRRDPTRVFTWYLERRAKISAVAPNAGHTALAGLETVGANVAVVTQNIDGLHQSAGSSDVVELHGSIHRFSCFESRHPYDSAAIESVWEGEGHMIAPPECAECGSPVRPDVVWFGEVLPAVAVSKAWAAAENADVMLVVGTSAQVFPAAELPSIAAAAGARVIEVNPERTPISGWVDVRIEGTAAATLPRILSLLGSAS